MFVHFGRIFAVAQKFEQVVIGQEVEPWKGSSFCLQERIQHLLRFIQAFRDVIEVSVEILDKESRQYIWFRMDTIHMGADPSIEILKFVDIPNKLTILILLGSEDGLEINPLSLDLGQHFQGL